MHLVVAIAAAIFTCFGVYLNDLLTRRRKALVREGLLGQDFDYAEALGLDDATTDKRLARYGMLRMMANAIGLIFFVLSGIMLYQAIYLAIEIDPVFWVGWGAATATATLFFWAGR